ncbi:MAG TPA: hypothetical protein PKD10_11020 [Paracoccaceae bacterium]|nr:hypothetical protein [Paracoccaceae bacterium]HMO72867.1 hypothetical protein [Paracoccaceae bacterium]
MLHPSLEAYVASLREKPARGPVAAIFAEDATEIDGTLAHVLKLGFRDVLMIAPEGLEAGPDTAARIATIRHNLYAEGAVTAAVNALVAAMPGVWLYYGFNSEYLFFPFCETRNVRELIAFHTEERRDAFLSYVIDLYAGDLDRHPDAVAPAEALLDRSGYYALGRPDPASHNHPRERQLDFFGGLRWRFEEHVPAARRKIDRIALFRARPGLTLREDFTFSDEEYNTYACPWHNNITTAVMSFRTAKALRTNPGSRYDIRDFRWRNSIPFQWSSQQLMDLGLMEPGQWF